MKELLNNEKYTNTSIRYEEISQWEVGKAVIDNAVNHWDEFGFLDGVDDDEKRKELAIAFDNVTNDLLDNDDRFADIVDKYEENCPFIPFDVAVYAMLRRVICGNDFDNGIDNFQYDKFLHYLERLSFLAINDEGYEYETDIEAEYIAIISKLIIELFKNNK